MTHGLVYASEPDLPAAEFIDVLHRSSLAQRRPVEEPDTITGMLNHADLVLTARTDGGLLIGVSRAITDFNYCTYLSDLAVDQSHQHMGIGRELLHRTHEAAGLHTSLVLLAAPQSRSFYAHIGMRLSNSCWIIDRRPRAG